MCSPWLDYLGVTCNPIHLYFIHSEKLLCPAIDNHTGYKIDKHVTFLVYKSYPVKLLIKINFEIWESRQRGKMASTFAFQKLSFT